jgi:ribonuclease T
MARHPLSERFRGFLPIVVDVETAGFDSKKDALLEVAMQTVDLDENELLVPTDSIFEHILPFKGANLDPKALEFNKIDPYHPFRLAKEELEALTSLFAFVSEKVKEFTCNRAVLVGHNSWFDLTFILQACLRTKLECPFHSFTSFDTATMSGLIYGHTVLSKALSIAKIPYDSKEAHSAIYDTKCTAKLFCAMVNRYQTLGGWPLKG